MRRSKLRACASALALVASAQFAAAQDIGDVPREETLIIAGPSGGQTVFPSPDAANPYLGNANLAGPVQMFEPLFYYNAFDDTEIPWLATGHEVNDDFTEVVVTLREGVTWSDGEPFTADDVVFTVERLLENAAGPGDIQRANVVAGFVERVEKTGDHEVTFHLDGPRPRFVRSILSNYFGNGMFVLPAHVWEERDLATDLNYDPAAGHPVTTGPWRLVLASPTQVILDRRDDWWAAEEGFHAAPAMRRIVGIPFVNTDRGGQLMVTNEADITMGFPVADVIQAVVRQNPAITTFTGREAPFGSLDWWNIAIFFNHSHPDAPEEDVRRAIGLSVDREMLIQAAYSGANTAMSVPFPAFGPMEPFNEAASALAAEHEMDRYDPERAAELMEEAGYAKDGQGFWAKDGERLSFDIDVTDALRVTGVVVQQLLQNEGFDITASTTPDSPTRTTAGQHVAAIQGHAGSIDSPIETLRQYHCENAAPPDAGVRNQSFARWCNERFSELVDEMTALSESDPAFMELYTEAMEIYYDEAVVIPLNDWYHRIPMNTTYWGNWPSTDNPYIQPGFWYRSGQGGYLFLNLEPNGG